MSPSAYTARPPLAKHTHASAFTLIELSIVLVIIGLIIGGVLAGRDLISAAAVRAQISQIEKYNAAVNTFYGKYGWLPGDIKDPQASSFGFAARGTLAGQGDGNGVMEGNSSYAVGGNYGWVEGGGETGVFWVDLSTAHLIEGSFNSAAEALLTVVTSSTTSNFFPSAKVGNGNYLYVWSGGLNTTGTNTSNGLNYFGLSAVSGVNSSYSCGLCIVSTPGLTVTQAYNIDNKVDDGLPQTGRITAMYLNAAIAGDTGSTWSAGGGAAGANAGAVATPSSATCYDNGGNSANPMAYSLSQNNGTGLNCALSFQMQGAAR